MFISVKVFAKVQGFFELCKLICCFFFVFCSVFTTFAANLENREKNEEDLLFLRRCSDGADSVRG